MRNIVINQGNLGDVLCSIPAVEQIHRNRPDVDLIVTCPEEYAGLFEGNPYVKDVNLPIQRDDQIYGMRWPLTREERAVPFVQWYARLAGIGKLENRLPTLYDLDKEEIEWPFDDKQIVVAIGTPTRWPTRNWPIDRYEEVLAHLRKEFGVVVVAVGKSSETKQDQEYPRSVDLSYVDELPVRKTAVVLSMCDLFLGNDSGLAHLAVASRIPAFTIFGPVHHGTHAHPGWTVPIQYEEGCHGCLTDGRTLTFPVEQYCPRKSECLTGITANRVIDRIVSYLKDLRSSKHTPMVAVSGLDKTEPSPAPSLHSRIEPKQPLDFSILVCCYRFLQRFRVFLQSLSSQTLGCERFEVVVVNPQSPDGLSEYLALYNDGGSMSVPGKGRLAPPVVEVKISEAFRRNRGYMIQRAFEASRGRVVMAADGDIVLSPCLLEKALATVHKNPNVVLGAYRNFLTPHSTAQIVAGLLNPIRNFDALRREDCQEKDGYRGVLGYCQIVRREAFEQVGYPEEFDKINQSDIEFVARLERIGMHAQRLEGETVLHLHHERNWDGIDSFM